MSTNSKKPKILSTTNLTNLVKKHAKRAHSADKASSSSRHAQQSNPELNTASDMLTNNPSSLGTHSNERNITSEVNNERNVTAEGYKRNLSFNKAL